MKRVLLVAFSYPPCTDVGSVRAAALAKYLPRFGWEPIVLTPKLPNSKRLAPDVVETEYRDLLGELKGRLLLDPSRGLHQQLHLPLHSTPGRTLPHTKLIEFIKKFIMYPDPLKGWIPYAEETLTSLINRKIDAIITTSPPISDHLIGQKAKQILKTPWIVDLRDLWIGPQTPRLGLHLLHRRLERRTLSQADAIVTVSEAWADYLRTRYSRLPVHSIMNGLDPDEFAPEDCSLTNQFTITYTGFLYQGRRDPTPLFETLSDLIRRNAIRKEDVRVRFYGQAEQWLAAQVRKYDLSEVVRVYGSVPRSESLQHQRESQIVLLLGMNAASDSGCYPAKLFEYLACRRPILALGGLNGAMSQLLRETGAGVHVFSKAELRQFLINTYTDFQRHGRVRYAARPDVINKYTQLATAERFALLLDGLVSDWERRETTVMMNTSTFR